MQLNPIQTPEIPHDFHQKIRKRFTNALIEELKHLQKNKIGHSACFFKGIPSIHKNYEDTDHTVEQQSTFWYLFGVKEPDCYASIFIDDDKNGGFTPRCCLFIPRLDKSYRMWMTIKTPEQLKVEYGVDQVAYVDETRKYFQTFGLQTLFLYSGTDSDSKLAVDEPDPVLYTINHKLQINRQLIWPLISNLRVIKTQDELNILRYVCSLTTKAHLECIRATKPGLTQIQLHALFHFEHTSKSGCIHLAFPSICSSGQDCATLHYIENDKKIIPGQLCLHDMGGKWYGYCADQAITFPADKKFTEKQKHIYNAVYQAQKAVLKVLKAGSHWLDMHLLAERVILQHLIKIGIIKIKGNLEEELQIMKQNRLGAVFFPHGLGHFIGLKVHDNGGYTAGPQRIMKPGIKSLRTLRVMEENMVITVEPGLYFIEFIIEEALKNPQFKHYLDEQKINEYREVGGVRLEDNVIILKEGVQMLSHLPRSIEDLQKVMANLQ